MNRKVTLGVAIFFAVVGLALIGGQKSAVAGHGCHGCAGEKIVGCDCGGKVACGGVAKEVVVRRCHGLESPKCCGIPAPKPLACDCSGRVRVVRCHGVKACHGLVKDCSCSGKAVSAPVMAPEKAPEKAPVKAKEKVPEAPKAASLAPMSFYQVAFRR